jgi:Zn-dependent M28 family amino/carboxypeptidase
MSASLADLLRQHVVALASAPRPPRSREHEAARTYITEHLRGAGFVAQPMRYQEDDVMWTNVLTDPAPADPSLPIFIVGAHYDSTPTTPGADDNASAVAALLELARWIRPRLEAADVPLKARLQLVAYDMEEYGALGSRQHVADLTNARADVHGMISLEMLGYCQHTPGSQQLPPELHGRFSDIGNFLGAVANEASAPLLRQVVAGLKSVPDLPVEFIVVPGYGDDLPETRLSDHSPFWDRDYPALMLTDTAFLRNRNYHQPSDTPDTLDYDFLSRVTQGVCEAVWRVLCE